MDFVMIERVVDMLAKLGITFIEDVKLADVEAAVNELFTGLGLTGEHATPETLHELISRAPEAVVGAAKVIFANKDFVNTIKTQAEKDIEQMLDLPPSVVSMIEEIYSMVKEVFSVYETFKKTGTVPAAVEGEAAKAGEDFVTGLIGKLASKFGGGK